MENRNEGQFPVESTPHSPVTPPPLSSSPPPPPLLFMPPPPPPMFSNGTSRADSAVHVDDRKKALERDQEDLRDSRDEYTGLRFHLQSKRKNLRNLREETGSKIGSAENQLRQFLHTLSIQLPQAIRDIFDEVSTLRDRLGLLEAEYDEIEGRYNRLEYTYTQKESRFVDQLPGSFLESGTAPRDTIAKSETEDLTRFADGALVNVNMPKEIAEVDLITPLVNASESRLSDFLPANQSASVPERANLCRDVSSTGGLSTQDDEPAPTTLDIEWMNKKERIYAWLLHILSCSPLQKAHLKAMGPSVDLSDHTWWEMLKEHWNDDFLQGPAFHTGDSTIPHSLTDCHGDISTLKPNDPESTKAEKVEPVSLPCPTGEPTDSADLSVSRVSVPSEVRSLPELACHVTPARQDGDVDEAQSVLTDLASTRQAFSLSDCLSMSTIISSCPDREQLHGHRMQHLMSVCRSRIDDVRQTQNSTDNDFRIALKREHTDEDVPELVPLLTDTPDPSSGRDTQMPGILEHTTIDKPSEHLGNEHEESTITPVGCISEYVMISEPDRISVPSSPQPLVSHSACTWPLSLRRCPIPSLLRGEEFNGWGRKSCPILKLIPGNIRNSNLQEPPSFTEDRYSLCSSSGDSYE